MSSHHPYRDVAVVGGYNTRQARRLPDTTPLAVAFDAASGVLAQVGLEAGAVDSILGDLSGALTYALGIAPRSTPIEGMVSIGSVLSAADAIASGRVESVLLVGAAAGAAHDGATVASYTTSSSELVAPFGITTPMQFALLAREHMDRYGTTAEQFATVSATIRTNGHLNPDAVYSGRGPFTAADVLASPMVADPFHLLDCAITSEGGAALLLTSRRLAAELDVRPAYLLGGGIDRYGPIYRHPPTLDATGARGDGTPLGALGARAARLAFAAAGLGVDDVDVCELYDPFPHEVIRQLEAFGFCAPGEGGPFVMDGTIAPTGRLPITTDGGLQSFSAVGGSVQFLQRVIRGVHQIQGTCRSVPIPGAEVVLCSNGGAAGAFCEVLLLGPEAP